MNRLPEKLSKLRKHYNYSQSYLSNILGVDVTEYMGYENGRSMIGLEQARKLASFYHIGLEDLFINEKEVTLIDVANPNTDEINIEYFIPKKTFLQKLKSYARHNPLAVGSALGMIGIFMLALLFAIFIRHNDRPYVALQDDHHRVAVSDTSVVYVDNYGAVKGTGSNANGQISSLPSSNAIKVAEGSGFTIVLNNDGTLTSIGLISKVAKEVEDWRDIVDVAAGSEHIVACDSRGRIYTAGDNGYGQCNLNATDIKKVFASAKASFAIDSNGKVYSAGEFIGSSQLNRHTNVKDLDVSDNNLVILNEDGRVVQYSRSSDFLVINTWNDIIDVATGNDFVAALTKDGKVKIAIDNDIIENEVSLWDNIVAIAAGNDYLIGFDGNTIRGVGRNVYMQFTSTNITKTVLPSVTNLKADLVNDEVIIQFDPVANASAYRVYFDAGTGLSYLLEDRTSVAISAADLFDNRYYHIQVVSLGDDALYDDSLPASLDYLHIIPKDDDEIVTIEIPLVGLKKDEFEDWLLEHGAKDLVGSESSQKCENGEVCIISVTGIQENERLSKSELANRTITYTYCRFDDGHVEKSDE